MKINHGKLICMAIVVITTSFFVSNYNTFAQEADLLGIIPNTNSEPGMAGNGWHNCNLEGITCQEAIKYFATCGGDQGSPCSTTITTELDELARSLQYDPKLIYDYVHNHINYIPYFGSKKGAFQTYLDGNGNDFDQASLMIALLRASGYTADFNYGIMSIPGNQIANWFGVDHDTNTIHLLIRRAMIPFEKIIIATGDSDIIRVWVNATIDGANYVFDPAFKSYTDIDGIDLATATGYDRNAFMGVATAGAETTDNYVKNINESGISNKLAEYSNNLSNAIKAQYPGSDIKDILGGRRIIPTNIEEYYSSLSFATRVLESWPEIPEKYMASLQVKYEGIDHKFTAPMIAGKRLTITFNGTLPELRLDGALIKTGNATTQGSSYNLEVTILHPYPADGIIANQRVIFNNIKSGATYAIVSMFNDKSEATIERRQKKLNNYIAQGLSDNSEKVLGETLNIAGQNWLYQTFLSGHIVAGMVDNIWIPHHSVLVAGQDSGYYIDAKGAVHSTSPTKANTSFSLTHLNATSGINSAFEHGIFEQFTGSDKPSISTIKIFQIANSAGKKIFFADKSNWSSVRPQLQNYSEGLLNVIANWVEAGHVFYFPEDGSITLNNWRGTGFVVKQKLVNDHFALSMIISGGYNGGYVSIKDLKIDSKTVENIIDEMTLSPSEDGSIVTEKSLEPIDMTTGDYLYDSTDFVLNGTTPLVFSRSYNSGRCRSDRSLGYGWTHNHDVYLQSISDGGMGLGKRHTLDAVDLITELFVITDLMNNHDDVKGWTIASLANKWAVDQLIDNVVVVHIGSVVLKFIKQSNGTYVSPPGLTVQLVDTGYGIFSLQGRYGTQLNFDSSGNATTLTDINGNTLTYNYSGSKLNSVQNEAGQSFSFLYNGEHISSISDSYGRSISYAYDAHGNLITYTDPENKDWNYGYDLNHWITSLKNPLSKTTAINTYDSFGRVTTQTVPRQTEGEVTYNFYFSGFRNSEEDPDGNHIIYHIDDKGRTTSIEDALGYRTSKEFDGQNNITKIADKRGNATNFIYDGDHNITSITNALNQTTNFVYDTQFRPISITDSFNHSLVLDYDSYHHITSITDSENITIGLTYKPNGLVDSITDGRGIVTTTDYDLNGNPESSTTASYPTVNYNYDSIGRMTSITDRVGATTTFAYDNRNMVTSRTDSLNKTATSLYNGERKLYSSTDRNGNTTNYTYTPTGKLEKITYSDSTDVSFSYNQHDKLTSITDPAGTTSYTYDILHRLTSMTDANGFTVSYVYDEADNVTQITYPGGKTVTYTYDELSRLETVTNWLGQTATYTYDTAGRLTGLTNFNSTTTAYGYDMADRLTSLENRKSDYSVISTYAFTLDGNGNRTQIIKDEPLEPVIQVESIAYTYNTQKNRLLTAGTSSFSYDDEGQLSDKDGVTYSFDYGHRLVDIDSGASTFVYNGAGNRISATRGGVETRYIYDPVGNLLAEADSTNNITGYYIHGLGMLAMMTSADQTYTYHYNAIGNTIAITDQSEDIKNKYAYTPFGRLAEEEETFSQPFKFVGRHGIMAEPDGLYYMRARYYDAETGRFISEDPIGFAGGDLNLYAYVANNPVLFVDPSGEDPLGIISMVINAGTGAASGAITGYFNAGLEGAAKGAKAGAIAGAAAGFVSHLVGGGLTGAVVGGITGYVVTSGVNPESLNEGENFKP